MKYNILLALTLLLVMISHVATGANAGPDLVTQGDFAGMLDCYLTQATNTEAYAELESDLASTNLTQKEIISAIEHLNHIGLFPYEGWQPAQPIHAHDITSLVVRLHRAEDRVTIADKDECMAYAISVGCDISTIQKIVRHMWENRPRSSIAGGPLQGVAPPAP